VAKLEARRPLPPLMRGRRAEGCGIANCDDREVEGRRSEENVDEG
jgi:hypothetical protein